MIKDIKIGDRVRWESAAGHLRGEVYDIRLGRSAADTLVPWIFIKYFNELGKEVTTFFCGSEDYLNMLKFRVNFRG